MIENCLTRPDWVTCGRVDLVRVSRARSTMTSCQSKARLPLNCTTAGMSQEYKMYKSTVTPTNQHSNTSNILEPDTEIHKHSWYLNLANNHVRYRSSSLVQKNHNINSDVYSKCLHCIKYFRNYRNVLFIILFNCVLFIM